ncbi:MAG: signal peptide peptidase SppA [Acidobacteriia bacterium]|nr:signal peptide peptidase SppA [Terriglobia bacterium]
MRRILLGVLATIGGLALLFCLVALVIGLVSWAGKGGVPSKTVLEADFEQEFVEYVPEDPVARAILGKTPVVRDVVEALERAADDDRVVAFVAKIGGGGPGLAQAQEIRDAVLAFRAKGKRAVAWSETFGEFGPGNVGYYLATAFDEIDLQPSGDVGLTGLMAESPFLRGTLDKLGVVPRMDHRKEFKNAMNVFTETKYTDAHREATDKLIQSMFGQMVAGIAKGRKLSETEVRALFDRGPFLGKEAKDAKLVDALAYRDEVVAKEKERAGARAKLLYLSTYLDRAGRPHESGTTVALIYGVGGVGRGESGYSPLFGGASMGSDTVTAAFRAAIEDKDVKAILFRVDSPGGSYVASDSIYRETLRAKEAKKPVIVSMGDVAGSGGYFVAMAADKIVAEPGTITASIGVLGGKMLTKGLWDKVGLSWDEVHTSAPSTMWSAIHDYSPQEWSKFEQWLDRVYDDFTGKVAAGRKLPREKVLEIAKGRIWTGEDAKRLGLVDELGGFPEALKLVRQAAGLSVDAKLRLKVFPKPRSTFDLLLERGRESSEAQAATELLIRAVRASGPLGPALRATGLLGRRGVLEIPEMEGPR